MEEKWIVVSGASRGLGLKITSRILDETSFNVIAISRTGVSKLVGSRCLDIIFDFEEIEKIPKLVKDISKGRRIFGCINNAAKGSNSILPTQHDSEILSIINCNLVAPILLSKYISRQMLRYNEGKVINIASVVAHTGYNGLATYAASKAGIIGLTKSLARELGGANIAVNSICPGFMETSMTVSLGNRMDQIRRRSPVDQLPSLDDVVDTVLFLLNKQDSRHTGHDYIIDAGNSI